MSRRWMMGALLLASAVAQASQFDGVSTNGNLSVWRINHHTGQVSLCSFEGRLNSPICYPWSPAMPAGVYDIVAGDDVLSTWRINTSNGAVSMCEYLDVGEPPVCTPWSLADEAEEP